MQGRVAELERKKNTMSNSKLLAENEHLNQQLAKAVDMQQELERKLSANKEVSIASRHEMEMEKKKDQETIEHLNETNSRLSQVI